MTGSLTGDMWIDLCCTVLLVALGNAVAYNADASTGGTEILVMALARHTSLPVGHAVAAVNAVVAASGVALYGPRVGVYCIVGLVLQTVIVNGVLKDLKCHKVCTVICRQPARVEEFIVRELSRTATVSYSYGAYSGRRAAQVMTVLTRAEALRLQPGRERLHHVRDHVGDYRPRLQMGVAEAGTRTSWPGCRVTGFDRMRARNRLHPSKTRHSARRRRGGITRSGAPAARRTAGSPRRRYSSVSSSPPISSRTPSAAGMTSSSVRWKG